MEIDVIQAEKAYEKQPHSAWDWFATHVLIGLASLALIGLTLVVTYDVIARSAFNAPTRWAYEVSKYLLAITVLFGAAHTMAMGQMIRVDIIYEHLKPSIRTRLDVIGAVCGFLFSSIIVYVSARLAWGSFQNGSTSLDLDVPIYLPQALVPVAALTLAIQCVIQFFKAVNALRARDK